MTGAGGELLCPNCKTELIEVNGRYICSDCGREIPENEVMTGDWSNPAPTATGLYETTNETSAPEEGSLPVAAFETPITESVNVPDVQSVEEVLQEQADEIQTPVPTEVPPIDIEVPSMDPDTVPAQEPVSAAPQPEVGFYTAPEMAAVTPATPVQTPEPAAPAPLAAEAYVDSPPTVSGAVSSATSFEPQAEPAASVLTPLVTDKPEPVEEILTSEPEMPSLAPDVQNIPVNLPGSEAVGPIQPQPESTPDPAPIPEQTGVVKDMFENVSAMPINDPGLYATPAEEFSGNSQMDQPKVNVAPSLSAEKRTNIIILTAGIVLGLCLIGGGTWGYLALSAKAKTTSTPAASTQTAAWQELQVVDASFKISFPGQPDKTEDTQTINSIDTPVISESYAAGDTTYTVQYATVNATAAALPTFVDDLASSQGLDVVSKSVGKYYGADAIDFTLKSSSDSTSYQGKIMLKGNTYILVMAGSSSGQAVEYDKFIRSFNFITADTGTGDTTN